VENFEAYSRCQENGGWITTTGESRYSAACTDRRSRVHGSALHTRCVTSRHGAWTAPIFTP